MEKPMKLLKSFEGREGTFALVLVIGVASSSQNVYGAAHLFSGLIPTIIACVAIAGAEGVAIASLRHIVTDWQNYHRVKAIGGAIALTLCVCGCVISGHKAFATLSITAHHEYKNLQADAERLKAEADKYTAAALATTVETEADMYRARAQRWQTQAQNKQLEVLKAKPLPQELYYVLLALFEFLKIGGAYLLATPTTKAWSPAQRKAHNRKRKLEEAEQAAALADAERRASFSVVS
jgi:hypothetical protein